MAYSIDQGYYNPQRLDRTQRGLLVGLPLLILILAIGALSSRGSNNSSAGQNAKRIPVVSTLSVSSTKPDSSNNNGSGNSGSTTQPQTAAATTGSTTGTTSTGGSSIIGGRGGGPTGGSTGGTGGGVTIPDCSLNQVATVSCMVPACSPAVTLAPGQKAILGVDGTCVVIN